MSYSAVFTLDLGPAYAGLTLQAQLVTAGGVDSGAPISAGFVERPASSGIYLWSATLADDFRGAVEFQDAADDSPLVLVAVNPEEINPLLAAVPGSYASGTAGAALGRIGSGQITTVSPVAQSGAVTLLRGDDYLAADGRALEWTDTDAAWPDLTGATVLVSVQQTPADAWTKAATVVSPTAPGTVRLEVTAANTVEIGVGAFAFDVQATLANGHVVTLLDGTLTVERDAR